MGAGERLNGVARAGNRGVPTLTIIRDQPGAAFAVLEILPGNPNVLLQCSHGQGGSGYRHQVAGSIERIPVGKILTLVCLSSANGSISITICSGCAADDLDVIAIIICGGAITPGIRSIVDVVISRHGSRPALATSIVAIHNRRFHVHPCS